jgi:hypothetical protein
VPTPFVPWLTFAALLHVPLAVAQSNLGELLDAGAKKLSPEEFKQEVVQRVIVGPMTPGTSMEVMYARTGVIQGMGSAQGRSAISPLSGTWTTDDHGRICTTMRIDNPAGLQMGTVTGTSLPPRCQYWYKHDERYFLSDSDSDRSMRVLRRTIKR